ncbi:O-antigen ligase family protein [Roseivirga sp.]|uniref:O-antigen ligase family protein n=1 Tax=Roseivirga sp. TaxID=1964215 RepID=UPI003B8B8C70
MRGQVEINIDRVIVHLLCCYTFLIPLEKILEVIFQIDTTLKPYRVLAILIIGCFIVRSFFRWTSNPELKQDVFLYGIFLYGLIITLVRMITVPFQLPLFLNDAFQISLYLGVFVVIRHVQITRNDITRMMKFLMAGILVNCLYFFNGFFFNQLYNRDGGFMDNPNYLALSAVVTILFLITHYQSVKGLFKRLLMLLLVFFLGYIIILAGSRTSFVILIFCIGLMFYFSPGKARGALVTIFFLLSVFLTFGGWNIVESAGPVILANRLKKNSSTDNRVPIWKGALKGAESANYIGLGIGQFKARFREFYQNENNQLIHRVVRNDYFLSPHSDYLALLAIYGALGLLGYLIFLFLTVKKALIKYITSVELDVRIYYQFGFLVLVSLILFGITNENTISPLFWILLTMSTRVNFLEIDNKQHVEAYE